MSSIRNLRYEKKKKKGNIKYGPTSHFDFRSLKAWQQNSVRIYMFYLSICWYTRRKIENHLTDGLVGCIGTVDKGTWIYTKMMMMMMILSFCLKVRNPSQQLSATTWTCKCNFMLNFVFSGYMNTKDCVFSPLTIGWVSSVAWAECD